MREYLDWSKLPTNLRYLAQSAEKYGHYQFEDKISDFLRGMSESEKSELTALLGRIISDDVAIQA